MLGGEIFVHKIPSMNLPDLAKRSSSLPLESLALSRVRKLHELMIGEDDARHGAEFDDHFAIAPEATHHPSMTAWSD